jgi:putative molybdopterin biosynthesis protein
MMKGNCVEGVEVGSTAGLAALMLGEADVSGVHLFDEESGTYNVPFIKRSWASGTVALIRGYRREQGLMLKSGNPKGIKGLEDICMRGVRFVNRNTGSGTRELFDRLIRERSLSPKEIRGYDFEVRTHEEVARAIEEGRADVGLGLRATAEIYGLDFVKVCEEDYDFAVETKRLGKAPVKGFIEALRSKEFQVELEKRAPGITPRHDIGEILRMA